MLFYEMILFSEDYKYSKALLSDFKNITTDLKLDPIYLIA